MKKIKIFISEFLYAPKSIADFFKMTKIAWHLAFSNAPFFNLNGVKLKIDRKIISINIYKSFLVGSYERGEHSILKRVLQPGDKLLEIGTGMGYNSICSAQILGEDNVRSFEANPNLIPIIKENYALNNFSIKIENLFLVNDTSLGASVNFYLSEDFWASNTFPDDTKEVVKVPTANFAEKIEEFKPNILLCDIEGGEIHLLSKTLPNCIKKIILDTHPFYPEVGDDANSKLFSHLLSQGFIFKSTYTHGFVYYFERS